MRTLTLVQAYYLDVEETITAYEEMVIGRRQYTINSFRGILPEGSTVAIKMEGNINQLNKMAEQVQE